MLGRRKLSKLARRYEEQREALDRDGYLIVDPAVDEQTLDRAASDMLPEFYEGDPAPFSVRDGGRIQDGWKSSEAVKAIALAPPVLDLLRGVYEREPLPFQTLNFKVGTQQPAHSDTIHFNSEPPGFMCGVWTALEDIDMDNGPLVYYPGSHKLREEKMGDAGLRASADDYPGYEEHIRGVIEREGLSPEYGTIKKGQALLWASNLLHGGAPQNDPGRTRLSQVTHYFFEGCDYYVPMLSEGDQIAPREFQTIG